MPAASVPESDDDAEEALAAVKAAEAVLAAAKKRAQAAKAAKAAKQKAAASSSASSFCGKATTSRGRVQGRSRSPDKSAAAATHVHRPRMPEPGLLLKKPVGMTLKKAPSPPKRGKERAGRSTPREQLRSSRSSSSDHHQRQVDDKVFLTLTPRSMTQASVTSVASSSSSSWWEAQPTQQQQRLVFPGEGIYAGEVGAKGTRSGHGKVSAFKAHHTVAPAHCTPRVT